MKKPHKDFSLTFIGFLQAFGIFVYCSLVAVLLYTGNELFGTAKTLLGPALILSILVASVLICALIAFGYPVLLFWDKKETKQALALVFYTATWLAFLVVFSLITFVIL